MLRTRERVALLTKYDVQATPKGFSSRLEHPEPAKQAKKVLMSIQLVEDRAKSKSVTPTKAISPTVPQEAAPRTPFRQKASAAAPSKRAATSHRHTAAATAKVLAPLHPYCKVLVRSPGFCGCRLWRACKAGRPPRMHCFSLYDSLTDMESFE